MNSTSVHTSTSTTEPSTGYIPGLEGVVAAETNLSRVDGQKGELIIRGFALEELAGRATFEEVVYLLWHGVLPTAAELTTLQSELAALRALPDATQTLLQAVAHQQCPAMEALRIAAGTLDLDADNSASDYQRAQMVLARIPTVVAAYWRLRQGQRIVTPNVELSHAANYLYMLTGSPPSPASVRGLETYLNTVVEHGLNASTFAARVIIATQSDMVSALVGAIGALKGPLHGGAPGPALDMVFEIGEAEQAEAVMRTKLERGERLMGFGHRIYKVYDPRAAMLAAAAEKMYAAGGDTALYTLAKHVEETAIKLLAEYKPGRNLQTNVEFYTALLLHGIGLDTDLFTPTFAAARTVGWVAHCFEHQQNGRLLRPKAAYVGDIGRQWVPLDARG